MLGLWHCGNLFCLFVCLKTAVMGAVLLTNLDLTGK